MAIRLSKKSDTPKGEDAPPKADKPKANAPKSRKPGRKPTQSPADLAKKALSGTARILVALAPFLAAVIVPRVHAATSGNPDAPLLQYYSEHIGFALIPLVPLVICAIYVYRNHTRSHPPRTQSGRPKRPPQPKLPSLPQRIRDVTAIIAVLDGIPWRVAYLVAFVGAIAVSGFIFPVSVTDLQAIPQDPTAHLRPVLASLLAPVAAYLLIDRRTASIINQRQDQIEGLYAVARDTLQYPKRPTSVMGYANLTRTQRRLVTPWQAIDVKEWRSLFEVDKFFVLAPEELSVDDVKKWDQFDVNLNAKYPRDEEWRVQRDPRGRGATVGAANYPTGVLWDGEYDKDPLTFYLGTNLETGERHVITLNDVSPHAAISGGTSSGKRLPLSSTVATPDGLKPIGSLSMGDEIATPDGTFAPVTNMSPIEEHPDSYRLTFSDGTWQDCDAEHLWTTWDRAARHAASRQRRPAAARRTTRTPWLTDEQRAILAAEIERSATGDDISVPDVIRLVDPDERMFARPFYEVANAIGKCRETQVTREFVYPIQEVVQEQPCVVFDRSEVQALANHLAASPSEGLRAAAPTVKVLEKNGTGPVSVMELAHMTGIDPSRVRGAVYRAGLSTLRKERRVVHCFRHDKAATRMDPEVVTFYPKRPLLAALIERGKVNLREHHQVAMPAVRTTREIAETLRYRAPKDGEDVSAWANHSIPRCAPVRYPERDLLVSPYLLGVWMGVGAPASGAFEGVDADVWEQVARECASASRRVDAQAQTVEGFVHDLASSGVLGNKRIPDTYMYSSVGQRLALLQGLMDGAGSADAVSGACEFHHDDEALGHQVRSLVASLGMIARLDPTPGDRGERKAPWTITFTPTLPVFRLPGRAGLIDPDANRAKSEHRYIVSVEPIEPVPMRCIMVGTDEHQFLVGEQYVPTHNTSAAEIVAAQMLVKPMPWDPNLHGMVVIVDPKGPFARRWRGRPGVVVADGQSDAAETDENGDPITGPMVMASAMEWLEEEHQRRAQVLAQYPDVGTWVHLPDEVKKKERFFPILIVMDEYIDHTDIEKNPDKNERIEKENAARITTTRLASWQARKVRNVGMHLFVIAQRVNMQIIGNVLMTNLPIRIVTGQMDEAQMRTMFQTDDIPTLPSTRVSYENGERLLKTIPGRARIMNAIGQRIDKIQVMWFGGKTNSETLDKWLPRGEVPPNGDFSLPAGVPRTAADFDAEGNPLIPGAPVAPQPEGEDLPMDQVEPSASDIVADGDPTQPWTPPEDDASTTDGPANQDVTPDGADAGEVFPAASRQMPRCEDDGCVNDAEKTCARCEGKFCQYHLGASVDPEEKALVCLGCAMSHPLMTTGVAEVYKAAHDEGKPLGLLSSYTVGEDGSVLVVIRSPRGKKLVEVVGKDGDVLSMRSKSGAVEGEPDEVLDRVRDAMSNFAARQAEGGEEQ